MSNTRHPALTMRPAQGSDLNVVLAILAEEGLVTEDVPQNLEHFFIAIAGQEMVGFGGFEQHGDQALLRSLVVFSNFRQQGFGHAICDYLENEMRKLSCKNSYLLTQSADQIFHKLDYQAIDRSALPQQIKATQQFSRLCPDSAKVMVKQLQ